MDVNVPGPIVVAVLVLEVIGLGIAAPFLCAVPQAQTSPPNTRPAVIGGKVSDVYVVAVGADEEDNEEEEDIRDSPRARSKIYLYGEGGTFIKSWENCPGRVERSDDDWVAWAVGDRKIAVRGGILLKETYLVRPRVEAEK